MAEGLGSMVFHALFAAVYIWSFSTSTDVYKSYIHARRTLKALGSLDARQRLSRPSPFAVIARLLGEPDTASKCAVLRRREARRRSQSYWP